MKPFDWIERLPYWVWLIIALSLGVTLAIVLDFLYHYLHGRFCP